jgi:NAD+-dependent protein deacetylase SIR2
MRDVDSLHISYQQLPNEFALRIPDLESADLLIIIGTSLTVEPFARLATFVDETCPRLLLNLEAVGGIGKRPNDVLRLGHCDDSVRELCAELGWAEELEELWKSTEILGQGQGEKESKAPDSVEKKGGHIPSKTEALAKHLEDALKISEPQDGAIQKSEKGEGAESSNVGKGAEKVDDSKVPAVVTSDSPGRVNV